MPEAARKHTGALRRAAFLRIYVDETKDVGMLRPALLSCFLGIISLSLSSCGSYFQAGSVKGPKQKTDTLPLQWVSGLLAVEIEVNGHPGTFILDNGFSLSGLDQRFAQKLGVRSRKSSKVNDGNNNSGTLKRTTLKSIQMGDFDFRKTQAYFIDMTKFLPCDSLDGIIGSSVFNKLNWHFNMDSMELYLSQSPFKHPGERIPVRYRYNNSHLIEVGLDSLSIPTQVDLGYTGEWKFKKQNLDRNFQNFPQYTSIGIHSLSVSGIGNADTLYVARDEGRLTLEGKALPVPGEIDITRHLKYNGRVGVGYLKNYNFSINSEGPYYILEPRVEENEWALENHGIGIYPIQGKYTVISYIPELGSFESVYREEVVAINGREMENFESLCEVREFMKDIRASKDTLQVALANGKQLSLPYRKIPISRP